MRRFVIMCVAAAGLFLAGAMASQPAQALSGVAPAGLAGAAEQTGLVEQARHRRWHHWCRWHRCYRHHYWGYYRPYRYYRPYWGYRRWYW